MKDSNIYIQRLLTIDSPAEGEKLWQFYEKTFHDANENSPIAQIFPKEFFLGWLSNERVIKLIATDNIDIYGISFITDQICLDWLLSPAYFAKHYSESKVYQIPVIGVAKSMRGLKVVNMLMEKTQDEIPDDGIGVFLHSKTHNQSLPELIRRVAKGRLKHNGDLYEADSEACYIFVKNRSPKQAIRTTKIKMDTAPFGEHLTIDGYFGDCIKLNDKDIVYKCLNELPGMLGMYNLTEPMIKWAEEPQDADSQIKDPGGWSGYVILAESHMSIHTFPKRSFVSADVYTCKNGMNTDLIVSYLTDAFDLEDVEINFLKRGLEYPLRNIC